MIDTVLTDCFLAFTGTGHERPWRLFVFQKVWPAAYWFLPGGEILWWNVQAENTMRWKFLAPFVLIAYQLRHDFAICKVTVSEVIAWKR